MLEKGKELAWVTQTKKVVAMVIRNKYNIDIIMAKKEKIIIYVRVEKIKTSKRWEKFIF